MLDLDKPIFYSATGRPARITEAVPVRRYHVEFSNGQTAWMTEEEIQAKLTNEPPKFTFDAMFANGFLRVIGGDKAVHFKIRRKFGDFPGQSLSQYDAMELYNDLGRWLTDRNDGDSRF